MSYYPPHGTGTTYPYGTYHNPQAYTGVQAPGGYAATPYQTPYPHTAGYGAAWPYAYPYYNPPNHPQQPQATTARPTTLHTPTAATTATTAVTTTTTMTPSMPTPAPQPAPPPVSQPPRSASIASYTLQQARETVAAAAAAAAASPNGAGTMGVIPIHRNVRKQGQHRGLFTKELRNLMYGFGDDRNPSNDTVNVMEEILIEYIIDVCQVALAPGKKSRLSIEDLRRALSRPADAKKLARMEELLFMQEDIKRARSQFEESDMNQASTFQS